MALKCPRCTRKTAYLYYGRGERKDGQLWRYKQKHCPSCGYEGTKKYTVKEEK